MLHKSLSNFKIKKNLKCFGTYKSASKTALLIQINRKTMNKYHNLFRIEIAAFLIDESRFFGEIEFDESYFAVKHIWKRACGAAGKILE
jgi:hypothetical protein